MKAIEFIKKFGFELAQRDIAAFESGFIKKEDFLEHYGFDILDDLKRYVDAYELVQKFGGIKRAKRILRKSYLSWNNRVSVVWNDNTFQCTIQQLEEAITLVEEVGDCNE